MRVRAIDVIPGLVRLTVVATAVAATVGCGDDTQPADSNDDTSNSGATVGSDTSADTTGAAETTPSADSGTEETAADGSTSSTTGAIEGCWDDLDVGSTQVIHNGFTMGSEGLAFGTDGSLYATTIDATVGTLWRIDASGSVESFAELPYALGLAAVQGGGFVVASLGVPSAADGGVYLVDARGSATLLTEGMIDSPNFVTITPDGAALVSDDFDTRVFRVALDGAVSVVLENVPSPNGMAYSPDGDVLYVASTFTADGQLTRYDVDAMGLPDESTAIEIMHLGPGSTPDGIAVDADGMVYVAANLPGEIWRVDGAARALLDGELVVEGISSPASLAFGDGAGFDPCSIYATALFGSEVVRVSVGVEGSALFH
ncbi:MAG: SMP-30/gluconolactonase/LRE family protein [Nannocystaceae bacterium]|nr:SMP-30/gluconolactonase/LRE family protein [Nannocystaceae bacterium]